MTVVDAGPLALADAAHASGCEGVCLFMQAMDVLPMMPQFDLVADLALRRSFRARLGDLGLTLDLAYPFTLAGRTDVSAFAPALDCAADLGAGLLNVLVYDRDAARRLDRFGAFCDLASGRGLRVAVEFYPASQIRTLGDALALVSAISRPGAVGVNADLLHLYRSGGTIADVADAPSDMILFGQISDGPETVPASCLEVEASTDRLLPGDGSFDIAGFVRALPASCPVSVEIPRNAAIASGHTIDERAFAAVAATRKVLT